MNRTLMDLNDMVDEELKKIIKKGDLTPTELEVAMKAVCLMEKIQNLESPDYSEGYSEGYPMRGYYDEPTVSHGSYMRGRSPVTGRYVSRGMGNYSGHSIKDRMIARLEGMYDEAQSDHERQVVDSWIKKIESEK